jgi:hypothetical protein
MLTITTCQNKVNDSKMVIEFWIPARVHRILLADSWYLQAVRWYLIAGGSILLGMNRVPCAIRLFIISAFRIPTPEFSEPYTLPLNGLQL